MRAIVLAMLLVVVVSSLVWAQGPDGKRAATSSGREYVIDSPRGERPYQPTERRFERRDDDGLSVGQALGLAGLLYLLSRSDSAPAQQSYCPPPATYSGQYGQYNYRPFGYRSPEPGYNPGTGQWAELLCPRCGLKFSAAANIYRCPEDGARLLWPPQ